MSLMICDSGVGSKKFLDQHERDLLKRIYEFGWKPNQRNPSIFSSGYDRRNQTLLFCVKAAWGVGFEGACGDYSGNLLFEAVVDLFGEPIINTITR